MAVQWFLLVDGTSKGPFDRAEVELVLSQNESAQSYVWWRGSKNWVSPSQWLQVRESVEKQALKVRTKTWKIRTTKGEEFGPFNEEELIHKLREVTDYNRIEIWTEGLVTWEPIYNIHQFMDSLGVCQRKHPRVPIEAQVFFTDQNRDIVAKVSTISEGGLGVENSVGLTVGTKISLVLKSKNLAVPIRASANVVYVSPGGDAGMCFDYIMPECKAAIIEYVRRETESGKYDMPDVA